MQNMLIMKNDSQMLLLSVPGREALVLLFQFHCILALCSVVSQCSEMQPDLSFPPVNILLLSYCCC